MDPVVLTEVKLNSPVSQLRLIPVNFAGEKESCFLAIYGADENIDPYTNLFKLPEDSLKMALFNSKGNIIWSRVLSRGVIPGVWFCPVFAFDLDNDGTDEIYYVNNIDKENRPFAVEFYSLERLDASDGSTTGQWKWPCYGGISRPLSKIFRNFIIGGYVHGEPVLITAQGTYDSMYLQAWNTDMSLRWEKAFDEMAPGAIGSHMCPVVDINNDGIDELMWGERCVDLNTGSELFCADRDVYKGHSDVIQPFLDRKSGCWYIYTIREKDERATPRVVTFDNKGKRVWGAVESGHMHNGWIARLGDNGEFVAMANCVNHESVNADGIVQRDSKEYTFEALTGKSYLMEFPAYNTIPVDFNGDGIHELVRSDRKNCVEILDRKGTVIGRLKGNIIASCSKLINHPGEQITTVESDGTLYIWGNRSAIDTEAALERYMHPFYRANQRLFAVGYNDRVLGGI
jgi:hypothetical protein